MKRVLVAVVGVVAVVVVGIGLAGCGTSTKPVKKGSTLKSQASASSNAQPVAPENNPTGDIPDSQVFIDYVSTAGGYGLKVPEGWASTTKGTDASFVDKFDGVQVAVTKATTAPTTESVQQDQVATLQNNLEAVQVGTVENMQTTASPVVRISYTSNSDPDSVTGKKVRLENQNYLFYRNGNLATLRLWAPQGADNVDQWKLISNSFKWQ